jgi:hypothetical protein
MKINDREDGVINPALANDEGTGLLSVEKDRFHVNNGFLKTVVVKPFGR